MPVSPVVDLSQGWLQASDLISGLYSTNVCPWVVLWSLHPLEKNLLSAPSLYSSHSVARAPSSPSDQGKGMYSQEDLLCCFSKEQFW